MGMAARDPRFWIGAGGAVLGVLLFAQVLGLSSLSDAAAVWRSPPIDAAIAMAGFHGLAGAPWGFPLAVTTRLVDPVPVAAIYTDSIPWLSLGLKAVGARGINPLALFWLISYVLQGVAMLALLRSLGVRRSAALAAGVALALLFPAWISRQLGHAALSGHWLLLFALALCVSSVRFGLTWPRIGGFAGLAALAAGVHGYHLVPIGACFGAALLSEVAQGRPRAMARTATASAAVLAALGLAAVLLGYGVGQGASDGGAILGLHSMNLAGPVMPQASALFGHAWSEGYFTGTVDPTGGQGFEGYNYLGAGVLLVLAGAAVLTLTAGRAAWTGAAAWAPRWGPLAAALVVLALWAVGPRMFLGPWLVTELPRPTGRLGEAMGLFRSHGRFFWSVGYMLLAVGIVGLDRFAGARTLVAVAAAAVVVQAFDVSQLQAAVRSRFVHAEQSMFPPALQQASAIEGRSWRFHPTYFCTADPRDRLAIAQLSLVALRRNGSSNSTPLARPLTPACDVPADMTRTAAPDDLRISVVLDKGQPYGPAVAPFAARADCYRFEQGLICGRGLEGIEGLAPAGGIARPWSVDDTVAHFGGPKSPLLGAGWSTILDEHAIWTDARQAWIDVPVPQRPDVRLVAIQLEGMAYAPPGKDGQRVEVFVDGKKLADWDVAPRDWSTHVVLVPGEMVRAPGPLKLMLSLPDAVVPGGAEQRLLGFALKTMTVSH